MRLIGIVRKGPGFDVIGLALSIWLELFVTIDSSKPSSKHPLNCSVSFESPNPNESVPLDAADNLITRTALYVLRCHGKGSFPVETHVHIKNPIPLGRGLGSSGAAVVAGVCLGSIVGELSLTKARMLDYCLMIERHPDNVAAALYGGLVGTYLNELDKADMERKEIPLSEVLPEPAGGIDTGLRPPEPPYSIGHYERFNLAKEIKCVTIIPDFEVQTAQARAVLPSSYERKDVVYNLQRIPLLLRALEKSPPNPETIYQAMQDKIHQPYRSTLIPGLSDILQKMTPKTHPGLCGICLSGAGPTILALATSNFEEIANAILAIFKDHPENKEHKVSFDWRLLEQAPDGAMVKQV